jgi:hypothetical protein
MPCHVTRASAFRGGSHHAGIKRHGARSIRKPPISDGINALVLLCGFACQSTSIKGIPPLKKPRKGQVDACLGKGPGAEEKRGTQIWAFKWVETTKKHIEMNSIECLKKSLLPDKDHGTGAERQ